MEISKLTIYTSNIDSQLEFYRDELNFQIKDLSEKGFEVVAGYSRLRFEYKENSTPYHIAFHVPDRQEKIVLQWLENIVPVLGYNDDVIIDFPNWQAKSVYFYDKDKNIMEFISRRDFKKGDAGIFSPSEIVGIAEVGLVTKNIEEKFEKLRLNCVLDKYDGDFDRFCAIGGDSGLIITINNDKKDWFPTNDKAYSSEFKLEFRHDSKFFQLEYGNEKLEISEI
ncbi:VOC family protein [Christiangramia sabulilitoris]|uniref:VOC family protein n=1 Tax=Christiangramia sabulilitoris TaxID=2583991 RepID=A0A550I7Q8_9FLAO|nr:VOC family protein [Christiangramia sabulilitoris]TRO67012.1 VOC family protein [Christiangramia sabulilitoris]